MPNIFKKCIANDNDITSVIRIALTQYLTAY